MAIVESVLTILNFQAWGRGYGRGGTLRGLFFLCLGVALANSPPIILWSVVFLIPCTFRAVLSLPTWKAPRDG